MSEFNISTEINRAFELASLRAHAERLTGQDWNSFQSIHSRFSEARENEVRAFHDEYEVRLESARKDQIDKAGSPDRKLTYRLFSSDRFDAASIERQANRQVHGEHFQKMTAFDVAEIKEMSALLEQAEQRSELKQTMKNEFSRVTDRRSKEDRRAPDNPADQAWSYVKSRVR